MQFIKVVSNETTTITVDAVIEAKRQAERYFADNSEAAILEETEQANGKYVYAVKNRSHKIILSLKQV